MRDEQWNWIKSVIRGTNDTVPFGVIVDSPWMPGYCGTGTLDFFMRPDVWLDAYRKIREDFPDLIFLPDYWVEFGMASETSGFGGQVHFFDFTPPDVRPIFADADDAAERIGELTRPDPRRHGLMPLILNLERYHRPRLEAMGHPARMVCARGPFTIGSYLLGVTEFMVFSKVYPDEFLKMTNLISDMIIDWLGAQLEACGDPEAVMVLDDACGFFSPNDFRDLALPSLKRIFDAFPDKLHFFHNDMTTDTAARFVDQIGVDVFNTTYVFPPSHMRELMGGRVTLLGSFAPMLLTKDDPSLASENVRTVLADYEKGFGSLKKFILSPGGGMPIGAKREPLLSAIAALKADDRVLRV